MDDSYRRWHVQRFEGLSGAEPFKTEIGEQNQNHILTQALIDTGRLGDDVTQFQDHFGATIRLLEQIASCAWGCQQGEHIPEDLARRVGNDALAIMRLTYSGLYDEAIVLLRSLAEIVSLLQLFSLQPDQLIQWKEMLPSERWESFGPAQVRREIEKRHKTPVVDRNTYNQLCEGVHISPSSLAVSHDSMGRFPLGSRLAMPGLLVVFGQIAPLLANGLIFLANLAHVPNDQKHLFQRTASDLFHVSPKVDLTFYTRALEEFYAIEAERFPLPASTTEESQDRANKANITMLESVTVLKAAGLLGENALADLEAAFTEQDAPIEARKTFWLVILFMHQQASARLFQKAHKRVSQEQNLPL